VQTLFISTQVDIYEVVSALSFELDGFTITTGVGSFAGVLEPCFVIQAICTKSLAFGIAQRLAKQFRQDYVLVSSVYTDEVLVSEDGVSDTVVQSVRTCEKPVTAATPDDAGHLIGGVLPR